MEPEGLDFSSLEIGDIIKKEIHSDWRKEKDSILDRRGRYGEVGGTSSQT